jgi:hypothetical protein
LPRGAQHAAGARFWSASRRVSVTVYWQLPAEANAHHASVAGVLPSH